MLAVLEIKMEWLKKDRTPQGAILRKRYYEPIPIEEGISLSGKGVFWVKCHYRQQGDHVCSDQDASERLDRWLYEGKGEAFTGGYVWEEHQAAVGKKSIQKKKGSFYPIDRMDIPCITIREEEGCRYRIRWYDGGWGKPRRIGGNEELYQEGAKLAGCPNTLNETAFILDEGKSGVLKYNYRCISFDDPYYQCYYIYVVNETILTRDIFIRQYDYEYQQMADLY